MDRLNQPQQLWWEQARSDHDILILLRSSGASPCHQLHDLQMVTEKLAKAYSWRTGQPPARTHKAFVDFLRGITNRSKADRSRIASLLGFKSRQTFEAGITQVFPLAYDLQQLAPALAGDNGPNPEYPWPTAWPTHAPASHHFAVWDRLNQTTEGRSLLHLIDRAIVSFPQYG